MPDRLTPTLNAAIAAEELKPATIGLVSQSGGSMMGAVVSRAVARAFSRMIPVGSEGDPGVAELLRMLIEEPETKVAILFPETFQDGSELAAAAPRPDAKVGPPHAIKATVASEVATSDAIARLAIQQPRHCTRRYREAIRPSSSDGYGAPRRASRPSARWPGGSRGS